MQNNFQEKDFERLEFRIDKVDILSYNPNNSFPKINKYPEFRQDVTNKIGGEYRNVFAYIVYTYDYRSPFVIFNDNLQKRKRASLLNSGFKKGDNDKYSKLAEDILLNKNKVVNRMIIRYLRILKNDDWMTLVGYQEALARQTETMLTGQKEEISESGQSIMTDIDPLDYSRIIQNVKSLRDNIKSLRMDFLTNDDNENLIDAIYDSIEYETLILTPEQYANQVYIGENPKLFNPYTQDKSIEEYILDNINKANKQQQQDERITLKAKRNPAKKNT